MSIILLFENNPVILFSLFSMDFRVFSKGFLIVSKKTLKSFQRIFGSERSPRSAYVVCLSVCLYICACLKLFQGLLKGFKSPSSFSQVSLKSLLCFSPSVSIMLQSSAKGFLRVPKGSLSIHKSFQGRKLQGSFKSASRAIKESFERASKKLQKSFKIGSRELYENPKRSLKELLREL